MISQGMLGSVHGWPAVAAFTSAGVLAGPRIRASVFRHGVAGAGGGRRHCPVCAVAVLPAGAAGLLAPLGARGRCPCCRARIGPAAGLVELVAGATFGVLALAHPPLPVLACCWLAATGVALVAVDAAAHRLPDPLTAAAAAGVLTVLAAAGQPAALGRALLAAALLGAGYVLLRFVGGGGLGAGDCKLAPAVGAGLGWLGWPAVAVATLLAFGGGALHAMVAAVGAARRRAHEAARPGGGPPASVPFGPWMVVGALGVLAAA